MLLELLLPDLRDQICKYIVQEQEGRKGTDQEHQQGERH
jgi:hypothetical protein